MIAAAIARKLLLRSPSLFDVVPPGRVFVGTVPQGAALPCVSIEVMTSTGTRATSSKAVLVTARVQLTVIAATYPGCKAVMLQLRRALRDFVSDVDTFAGVTCRMDGEGPDFQTDAGLCAQTQDVRITHHEVNLP